jgi:hypothetical protein
VTREWRRAIATARAHCEVSELLRHSELPGLLLELSRGLESVHKVMEGDTVYCLYDSKCMPVAS